MLDEQPLPLLRLRERPRGLLARRRLALQARELAAAQRRDLAVDAPRLPRHRLAGRAQADEAARALQHTAGFLRSSLAQLLSLYSVPQLHFVYDDSIEAGMKLAQLIDDAVAADRKFPSS